MVEQFQNGGPFKTVFSLVSSYPIVHNSSNYEIGDVDKLRDQQTS